MKSQDCYTAKEAFTFPLFCLVCLAFNIYWGCSDVWPVGAIVGASFFGIFTFVYVFKYSRFGRDYLRIDANGITSKEWSKTATLKWSEIAKCTVCYIQSYGSGSLFYRVLDIILLSEAKRPKSFSVRLSGKYCRNKSVITAIEQFGGSEVYDSQSSHAQNMYLGRIILFAIGLFVLFALLSCNNRHDLTENYSVFTYGEGLYGESEEGYPVFVSKLGYKDAPPFIANIRQVWWNDSTIIIEQNNDYWWIVTAVDSRLSYGDKYVGPLSAREKDSIMVVEKIRIKQMKHWSYE
ncbi:hypothetical protein [Bacteroides acidifaciens]|uniref:hypothetical protein n=2 Tax=Bacteroides acidifaciens TaxID=85831 RepID=UPI000F48AB93|nr:hypothetical protein [Bacteroides acidifaciens]ROT21199.1 hypothetical protein EEL51_04475 [Muribaculaceae bacterium Isolate-110 (HZI)]